MDRYQTEEANEPVAGFELRYQEVGGRWIEGRLDDCADLFELTSWFARFLLEVTNEGLEIFGEIIWRVRRYECNRTWAMVRARCSLPTDGSLNGIPRPDI